MGKYFFQNYVIAQFAAASSRTHTQTTTESQTQF